MDRFNEDHKPSLLKHADTTALMYFVLLLRPSDALTFCLLGDKAQGKTPGAIPN
jgi:hypothetical protein